ncbi:MAG: hypothetical protein NZ927_04165 [Candidatus Calescibacterium sp.]|nr:hypothetical protein [Candidatus Calescibacterium sp.]
MHEHIETKFPKAKKRICLITHYFPPLFHISKRPYYLAYHLSEMGYKVCVLTTSKIPLYGYIGKYPEINFELVEIPNKPFDLLNKLIETTRKRINQNQRKIEKIDQNIDRNILIKLKGFRDLLLKIFGPNFDIVMPWIPQLFFTL